MLLTLPLHPPHTKEIRPAHITPYNWRKANWQKFREEMERQMENFSWDCPHESYHKWAARLRRAALKHIPLRTTRKRGKVWMTKQLRKALQERNAHLKVMQSLPSPYSPEVVTKQKELQQKADLIIHQEKQKAWREHCEAKGAPQENLTRTFHTLKELDGRTTRKRIYPIAHNGAPATDPETKGKLFGAHYSKVSGGSSSPCFINQLNQPANPTKAQHPSEADFTLPELQQAIKKLQPRKAAGVDGIYNEMLKHLGPKALQGLLHILNVSWKTGSLPDAWRKAIFIPIHKQGKDSSKVESYRPVSLTSCVSKVFETILLSRMEQLLCDSDSPVEQLHRAQTGFRRCASTEEQLGYLLQEVRDGVNTRDHCAVLFCDMKAAFDKVSRKAILKEAKRLGFPPRFLAWIKAFLSHRRAKVSLEGIFSDYFTQEEGVPQGSILSPLLFSIALNVLIRKLDSHPGLEGIKLCVYADDIAVIIRTKTRSTTARLLQETLLFIESEGPQLGLHLSPTKTCYTEYGTKHQLRINRASPLDLRSKEGIPISLDPAPRYLGIIIDEELSMTPHLDRIATRFLRKIRMIRVLCGATWGADTATIRATYLTYALPVLTYAFGTWGPLLGVKQMDILEHLHNIGARVITDLPTSTKIQNLLWEAHLEPMKYYRDTLSTKLHQKFRREPNTRGHQATLITGTNNSWIDHAENIINSSFLKRFPTAPLYRCWPINPWQWDILQHITFSPTIPGAPKKDEADPYTLKALTEIQLALLEPQDWWAYTDGSVEHNEGGAGVVLKHRSTQGYEQYYSYAGSYCCSYTAELQALGSATLLLSQRAKPGDTCVIATDSQSAIRHLEGGPSKAREKAEFGIWTFLSYLAKQHIKVHFQYVPSHIGIEGNELADETAAMGRKREIKDKICELSYRSTKRAICNLTLEAIGNRPDLSSVYSSKPRGGDKRDLHKPPLRHPRLKRKGEVVMRRLRTGRHDLLYDSVTFNHRECPDCHAPRTLSHLLLQCPAHQQHRQTLTEHSRNIHDLLLHHQVPVLQYLVDSGLLQDKMETLTKPALDSD